MKTLEKLEEKLTFDLLVKEEFISDYDKLTTLIQELNNVKKTVDENIKDVLHERYLKTGEVTIDNEIYKMTYIPSSLRGRINSKKLKEEEPEIYEKYTHLTEVSSSLRVTKKKAKKGGNE